MTGDEHRPSPARMYNLYLGGTYYGEIEQEFADSTVYPLIPFIVEWAELTRGFLQRAVTFCHEQGIRQFIDAGAGYPVPEGNVHEIAADARVVYVDHDRDVAAVLAALAGGESRLRAVHGDISRPRDVLARIGDSLDLSKPAALLMNSVLHSVEQPTRLVREWVAALAPGSFLVLSHAVAGVGLASPDDRAELVQRYLRDAVTTIPRTAEQVAGFFGGLDLIPPGLVPAADWRSSIPPALHDQLARRATLAGVGRKPHR